MTYVLVALGGGVGAPLRYLVDRLVSARRPGLFPWGTLAANVVGCLVLGVLAGAGLAATQPLQLFVGTGVCGALTTYSTFAFETVRLAEKRAGRLSVAYSVVTVAAGVGVAFLGWRVGVGVFG